MAYDSRRKKLRLSAHGSDQGDPSKPTRKMYADKAAIGGGPKTLPVIQSLNSCSGGGGGIRTRDTVSRIHTFQACAFDRSATPPNALVSQPCSSKDEAHNTAPR